MELKQERLEAGAKKKNIIIEGLIEPKTGQENLQQTIKNLFLELGITHDINLDQTYRLGRYDEKRSRPLLISFIKTEDREYVFAQRATLKRSQNYYNVWLTDDITPSNRRLRSVLRQVTKEAKETGARCTSSPFAVTIDRKKYEVGNLESLPADLSLEKIKTKHIGENIIAYHSEHSPFSNLYPCVIRVAKKEFTSVEQVLQ